jgi:hypothetical protein
MDYVESQVDLDTVPPVIADRVRQSLRGRVDLAREGLRGDRSAGGRLPPPAPRSRARATR